MSNHPYKGPKRPGTPTPRGTERPRERGQAPRRDSGDAATPSRPPRERSFHPADRGASTKPARDAARDPSTHGGHAPRRDSAEVRLYGLNACRAAFAARPDDLRKVYLSESRIATLRDVLAWCVKHRLGYRVVEDEDLQKLAASSHHEGVIFEMRERAQPTLAQLLARIGDGPQTLLWLDGVGNPHNFGALLRNAAHFGSAAVLLPAESPLTLSGAAYRVAEGGAEAVDVVRLPPLPEALQALRAAGFMLVATLPAGGESIYASALASRLVLVFGAEGSGMQRALVEACERQVSIPGSGRVESLNIANATAILLGECWRRAKA